MAKTKAQEELERDESDTPEPEIEAAPEPEPEPEPEPVRVEKKAFPARPGIFKADPRTTFRLKVKTDRDGQLDWKNVKHADRKVWQEILKTPGAIKALKLDEIPKEETKPKGFLLSSQAVGILWDILAASEAVVFAWFYGAPRPLAVECFALDEQDKLLLIPPTQRVIEKWAPESFIKFQDEINLLLAYAWVTQIKMHTLKVRLAEEREKAKAAEAGKSTKPDGGIKAGVSGTTELTQ